MGGDLFIMTFLYLFINLFFVHRLRPQREGAGQALNLLTGFTNHIIEECLLMEEAEQSRRGPYEFKSE